MKMKKRFNGFQIKRLKPISKQKIKKPYLNKGNGEIPNTHNLEHETKNIKGTQTKKNFQLIVFNKIYASTGNYCLHKNLPLQG